MPTLEDLIENGEHVRFVSKVVTTYFVVYVENVLVTKKALRVNRQGHVQYCGGVGKLVWFQLHGSPEEVILLNLNSGLPVGYKTGQPRVNASKQFKMVNAGDGYIAFANQNERRFLRVLGPKAAGKPDNSCKFMPFVDGQPFPILDIPEVELTDDTVFLLKLLHSFDSATIAMFGCFTSTSTAKVELERQSNNAFQIIDSTGNFVLSETNGCLVAKRKEKGGTDFMAIVEENPPEILLAESSSESNSSESSSDEESEPESDAEETIESAPSVFLELLALPPDEREEQLEELSPTLQAAFPSFLLATAQEKIRKKRYRHHKRHIIEHADDDEDEEEEEDIVNLLESILAMDDSDDDVDDDEVAEIEEQKERIDDDARAEIEAEIEAMREAMEQQRQEMEAERERMAEEQARLREEMEAQLAALEEEDEEEDDEEEEEEEEAEEEEDEEEEEEEDEEEEQEQEEAVSDADELSDEYISIGEETIEHEVELPPTSGTVHAADDYDEEENCRNLKKAMRGWGCNKKKVVTVLSKGNREQRLSMIPMFKTMYGKDLCKSLSKEVTGKTGRLIQAMMKDLAEFEAWSIKQAISGFGRCDKTLIEIICTSSNDDIAKLKKTYERMYGKSLEDAVSSSTRGRYKRLLLSLLQGGRCEENDVDEELAEKEARLLHKSTKGWFTDKSSLNQVLALRNPAQLRATFNAYLEVAGKDITHTLKRRLDNRLASGMIAIVSCCRNPSRYFANRIYRACRGFGTDDTSLIRIIVSRSEVSGCEDCGLLHIVNHILSYLVLVCI
eukprot:gene564-3881_t